MIHPFPPQPISPPNIPFPSVPSNALASSLKKWPRPPTHPPAPADALTALLERKREILAGMAKERQVRKPADSVPVNLPEQAKETRDSIAAEIAKAGEPSVNLPEVTKETRDSIAAEIAKAADTSTGTSDALTALPGGTTGA